MFRARRARTASPCNPRTSAALPTPTRCLPTCGSWIRTLVRMDRGWSRIEPHGSRSAIFGRPGLLLVVAARCCSFGGIGTYCLHVTRQLPHLLGCHLVPEGRHAVGPAVTDRSKDGYHFQI